MITTIYKAKPKSEYSLLQQNAHRLV